VCPEKSAARGFSVEPAYPWLQFFENLEDGLTIEEIMEQFDVTREQVTAVLDFAARSLEAPIHR